MDWLRVEVCLSADEAALVEQALLRIGAISIELSDAGDTDILEPAPGTTPLWSDIRLRGLFTADVDPSAITDAIEEAVGNRPGPPPSFAPLAERDWVSEFKQSLSPMKFGDRLWVYPTGQYCPESGAPGVSMDPGLAFGSGKHPTTSLCLDWLARESLLGSTVLDYGCGSGVLGLASIALGASLAAATDIDPQAHQAARENAQRNGMLDRLAIGPPDGLQPGAQFDVIVANILSNTLIELAPVLQRYARSGTRIALSGILADQITQVNAAYAHWVNFSLPARREQWAMLHGTVI